MKNTRQILTTILFAAAFPFFGAVQAAAQQCDIVVSGTPTIAPNPVTAGNSITVGYTIHNNGPGKRRDITDQDSDQEFLRHADHCADILRTGGGGQWGFRAVEPGTDPGGYAGGHVHGLRDPGQPGPT